MLEISLSDMKKNDFCIIKRLETKGKLRRRLLDLGFTEGTKIRCVNISPFGDPKAFSVRGTVIALRKEDSSAVLGVKL